MRLVSLSAGTAAIEFALGMPLLLVLLAGVVEVGFGAYQAMQVQDAAEAGALYAAKRGWDAAGISAAVVNALGAASGVSASPAPVQFCGCPTAGGISVIACSSTCPSGNPPSQYVQINAALPHVPILSLPGLSIPTTLTGQAIVRVN